MMKPYVKRRARRPPSVASAIAGGRRSSSSKSVLSRFDRFDDGAVTAEFASVLPAVLMIAILLFALARGVMVSMTCQDAASAAARSAVSAGGGEAGAKAAARTVAGRDVDLDIDYDGDTVTVVTHCPVVPDPMGVLPTSVTGKAVGVVT